MRALFKFNNLGLALGMSLKFYTTVAQGLKLKVKVLGANSEIRKSDTGKTVGGDGEGGGGGACVDDVIDFVLDEDDSDGS